MESLNLLKNLLIIAGAIILFISLFPIQKLMKQVPDGSLRNRWYVLSMLILLFFVGYMIFLIVDWNAYHEGFDIIVPLILFFGAIFVLLTSTLAMRTARDLLRISTLEKENITDPLMDVYNRRHFDRRLTEEMNRAHRYGSSLVLFMIDVDHFKKVNDLYGHDVGDEVLKKIGKLVQENVRRSDIVARYGGEEIAVIAPETNLKVAHVLGERIRQTVENEVLLPADDKHADVKATISIGIAGLGKDSLKNEDFIQCADQALYQAKEEGRNKIIVCTRAEEIS